MMELFNIEIWKILIGLAIFIGIAELMYWLGQEDKKIWFTLVYSGTVLSIILNQLIVVIKSVDPFELIISVAILTFIGFVGTTLYEMAGNNEKRWYYLALIFPPLAIVYKFTQG